MATEFTEVLFVINRHIHHYEESMNDIIAYELDMANLGCPISKSEAANLDKRWMEYSSIKNELTRLRDEIMQGVVQ